MAAARSIAEEYHRLTNYTEATIRASGGIDWSRQPKPEKEIVSDRRVSLRPWLPFRNDPFTGQPLPPAPPSLGAGLGIGELSRLLFYANGVTGVLRYEGGGVQALRAAPSAGALYPTETYLAVRDLPDLEPAIYNYQPQAHELVPLWEGDWFPDLRRAAASSPALADARACLILTGVFWRSAWRYQERGYRRVLLDTGHVLGNVAAYAPHERCSAIPIYGFADGAVNGLLFFDDAVEAALAIVPILEETAACEPEPLLASPVARAGKLQPVAIAAPESFASSVACRLHRASACPPDAKPARAEQGDRRIADRAVRLRAGNEVESLVPQSILRRRSARRYSGGPIPLEALGSVLGYAFGRGDEHGAGRAVRFATREGGLLDAHLVALEVTGLDPGVYGVERDGEALLRMASSHPKEELFRVCLGQEIARTCAALLVLSAPLHRAVLAHGERAYRYLHLEAGHLGQRLQIAAGALGFSACGIGGFLDEEVGSLLDLGRDEITLYMVTLGREP